MTAQTSPPNALQPSSVTRRPKSLQQSESMGAKRANRTRLLQIGQGRTVQGGWTPPSHNAVLDIHLDDHRTKLYAAAKSRLQSYDAALAERRRKAALLSDGKKMENLNGRPCVKFVFAMFRKNVDSLGHSKTWRSLTIGWAILRLMRMVARRRSKMSHRSRMTRRSTDGMLGFLTLSANSNNLIGNRTSTHP